MKNMIMINRKMNKLGSLVLFGAMLILSACSEDDKQTVTTLNNLVLEDNFDVDGAPDPNLWGYDLGDGSVRGLVGWGNNELQFYTDEPDNIVVENGMLKITAKEERRENSNYTSARILTQGKFQKKFGRFEARMKLPYSQGIWPAFWMLGDDQNGTLVWPQLGEIDIMEYRGQNPTEVLGTVHGPGYSGANAQSKSYNLINDRFDTSFHIFGIEWGPDYVNYYVDDVLYNQITPSDVNGEWVFNDNEFYLLINLAVGGSFVGSPNENTVFPQTLLVDYVRVYE